MFFYQIRKIKFLPGTVFGSDNDKKSWSQRENEALVDSKLMVTLNNCLIEGLLLSFKSCTTCLTSKTRWIEFYLYLSFLKGVARKLELCKISSSPLPMAVAQWPSLPDATLK